MIPNYFLRFFEIEAKFSIRKLRECNLVMLIVFSDWEKDEIMYIIYGIVLGKKNEIMELFSVLKKIKGCN